MSATRRAEIRDAGFSDVEPVCKLLADGFAGVPVPFWRSMVVSPWLPQHQKPDIGAVIAAGDEIVGFLGAMYSDRFIEQRKERFCNVFAWYVQSDFRHYSISLLTFLARRPGLTFVNVTPASHVVPIFERLGFRLSDDHRVVCLPAIPWRRSKIRVVPESEVNPSLLGQVDFSIYSDHFGCSVRRTVFESSAGVCLLITKRMYWAGARFPRTDVYYASDWDFVAKHLDDVITQLLVRDKTVALHCDSKRVPARRRSRTIPAGSLYPSATLFRSDSVGAQHVDRLYSELVLLP